MMKLRPVLEGDWWRIGPSPDLAGLLPAPARGAKRHECVDHHVFRDGQGLLHLWGCIRGTSVGRILYHWRGRRFTDRDWTPTGQIIRCDRTCGESLDDWDGQEWLQSPFFVREGGQYHMFYGGHGTGADEQGRPATGRDAMACQICLMTSPDGQTWTRHRDRDGHSRLFVGPGEARDPCVLRIGGLWHMYYAGFSDEDHARCGFYCRTSRDLVHWSAWRIVHQDLRISADPWGCECPHVVRREGFYYLLRTEDYYRAQTHVFRSADPMDFGVGDAGDKYVGTIPAAAAEIHVDDDGLEYLSSNHDPAGGTQLCRLRWEQDDYMGVRGSAPPQRRRNAQVSGSQWPVAGDG